ncbi:MAG: hypothetical protein JNL74_01750, partial [Fibrobacteres bacterium]|nr:hypothetical protein [Fibrobacterota bacterium]
MDTDKSLRLFRLKHWLLFSLLVVILTGVLAVKYEKRHIFFLKRDLMTQAEGVASALSLQKLQTLKFDSTDLINDSYKQYHQQFKKYADNANIRSLYSVKSINGQLKFGPENLVANDSFASLPGTVYEQPPKALYEVFESGQSRSIGPYKDEYGSFVSAFAPVIDPVDNKVYMVIGIDMTSEQWTKTIRLLRLEIALYYGFLLIILVLVSVLLYLHQKDSTRLPRWFKRHSELILAASAALFVTATASLQIFDIEYHQNRALFSEMAKDKKNVIKTALSFMEKSFADTHSGGLDNVEYQPLLLVDQSDVHVHDALMHQHLVDITDSLPKCLAHLPVHNCHFDEEEKNHSVVATFPIFFGGRTFLFKA